MGAWGTGIFDNDTACDVKDDFIDYIEDGKTPEEATSILLDGYLNDYVEEDLEELSLVYLALAAIQIEKQCLQERVRTETIKLIDRGADLELWEGSDDFKERVNVLEELKQKLVKGF